MKLRELGNTGIMVSEIALGGDVDKEIKFGAASVDETIDETIVNSAVITVADGYSISIDDLNRDGVIDFKDVAYFYFPYIFLESVCFERGQSFPITGEHSSPLRSVVLNSSKEF